MSTITTIASTDAISDSRSVINTNFSNLNADKIEDLGDLGITATATELNYCDGVTSNIQTQIDAKDAYITGEVRWVAFGEGSLPSGWLLCYGQDVSRSTYATLFSAIGTTFGVGNGSTTFTLPDLRGRVIAGKDDMGGASANVITDSNADSLGGEYGSETHTLTASEIPAHTHPMTTFKTNTTGSNPRHTLDGASTASTASTDANTGGGGAHNNVQPTLFLNAIIKT